MNPKSVPVIAAIWFVLLGSSVSALSCDWMAAWPRSATDPLLWKYEVVVRAKIEEMSLSTRTIYSKHGSAHAVWYRLRVSESLRGPDVDIGKPLMAYAPASECKLPHPELEIELLNRVYVFVLKKSSVGLQIVGGDFP